MSRNTLLIIDPQIDFHPGGSLAVNGADEDSGRTANFIASNIHNIDQIVVTLDTHHVSKLPSIAKFDRFTTSSWLGVLLLSFNYICFIFPVFFRKITLLMESFG